MIYLSITKPKYRNFFRIFVLILVTIFTFSLYSCQTTSVENYSPEQLRAGDNDVAKVLEVTTKTDSIINLEDYDAKYYRQFDEAADVILFNKTDSILTKSKPNRELKLKNNFSKISLQDILYARIEKKETNVPLTVLAVSGAAILTVSAIYLFMYAIFLSSTENVIKNFHLQ